MNFFDVQTYLIIKLLLVFFVILSIVLVYKKYKPVYFLLLVGLISAASYFFFVNDMGLLFWGLQGDEVTIAAMYNIFTNSSFLGSDFAYHGFSAFYPLGFFWFFGQIGKIMDWNGIVIAKFATFSFFLLFPICLYYYQKKLLNFSEDFLGGKAPRSLFYLLSPLLIITILDKDLLIGKPYEVIAVAASIFWYLSLYFTILYGKWTKKIPLIYGFIAGIIFMVYYLWLIFVTLSFFIIGFFQKKIALKKYFLYLF